MSGKVCKTALDYSNPRSKALISKLMEIGSIKFGSFTLKSGIVSPVYIDLRVIVSHPAVLMEVARVMQDCGNFDCQCICGVPYTALPIATVLSCLGDVNLPMVIRRKEAKSYGTKKIIEGSYQDGDECLIIEDVVTTGSSVLETAKVLRDVGLTVRKAIVFLNRSQGGEDNLRQHGIELTSVFSLPQVVQGLFDDESISSSQFSAVQTFLRQNQSRNELPARDLLGVSVSVVWRDRLKLCRNSITRRLCEIVLRKKSNLCVAADVSSAAELLEVAAAVGPHICVLKTHIDMIDDFSERLTLQLREVAEKFDFLLFEDRKFADTHSTVEKQLTGGVHKIASWANIIDVHAIAGLDSLEPLQRSGMIHGLGCLLIAEMSTKNNLISAEYTQEVVRFADLHQEFICGFICQKKLSSNPNFLHFSPGVHLLAKGDGNGQQFRSPQQAIAEGCDVIIVGRGITAADDPASTAKSYKTSAWVD